MTPTAREFPHTGQHADITAILGPLRDEDFTTDATEKWMCDDQETFPTVAPALDIWPCDTGYRLAETALTVANDDDVGEDTLISAMAYQVVSLPPEPSPTLELLDQLHALMRAPGLARWAGAVWPSSQAFLDATAFVLALPLHEIPSPVINVADDGEVNFSWDSDGVYIDLGFYGTGEFSYFARGGDGSRYHKDDVMASEGMPSELADLFLA